jgi:hypothetical protein
MDDIISGFKKLSTQSDVDDLIEKIENTKLFDPNEEWKNIQSNYSKLKYLQTVIINTDKNIFDRFFLEPFRKFLEKIDSINRYYFDNVSFNVDDYNDNCGFTKYDIGSIRLKIQVISSHLKISLDMDTPDIHKLNYILIAYQNIIELIEDYRGECFIDLLDYDFINNFSNKKIKR